MSRLLCLLIFACFSFTSADEYFDDFLDSTLDALRPKILDENMNEVEVPDFEYEWTTNIVVAKLYGKLSCKGGHVRALATIFRSGQSDGEVFSNGTAYAEAALGLRALYISFTSCTLKIKDLFYASESIEGIVEKNSIRFRVTAIPDETSVTATIENIDLQELRGIRMTTGSGIIHQLKDEVLNAIIPKFHESIFNSVSKALKTFEGRQFHITSPEIVGILKMKKQ